MFSSAKYSYLALKLGLAAVFLWFGIDKIVHPSYWLNIWMTPRVIDLISYLKLSGGQFIYLCGIFEALVGISLVAGIFSKFFSILAILFLISVAVFVGSGEIIIRDLSLIGGFVAVFLWPDGRNRF